ncbi:MAG: type I restriction enzyme HsdR N-terminal domain-containing protein [Saprospiraceae bacterium]|nr:type I restriction enzyme HsdR N-terminal domain-containing protein [Saprospiraceae bacterium]
MDYQDQLSLKTEAGKRYVWDAIRKKWLVFQPEEMVRQLIIHFLIAEKGVPRPRIAVEKGLYINQQFRRTDIIVYDQSVKPFLLIECKAPSVPISEGVFRQIAHYNMALKVPNLWVSNGPDNYACAIDFAAESFSFLSSIPSFPTNL